MKEENTYAEKYWVWILLFLAILALIAAVVAIILQFLYSSTYPSGYVVTFIDTKVDNGILISNGTVTTSNRNLYVFKPASTGTATSGLLSLNNVRSGMQFMVYNNTLYPLTVKAGTSSVISSSGLTLVTKPNQGNAYNTCIPTNNNGSFSLFGTNSIIPPGATFSFISSTDNNINLIQSTPIDVLGSGSSLITTPCFS